MHTSEQEVVNQKQAASEAGGKKTNPASFLAPTHPTLRDIHRIFRQDKQEHLGCSPACGRKAADPPAEGPVAAIRNAADHTLLPYLRSRLSRAGSAHDLHNKRVRAALSIQVQHSLKAGDWER